MECGTTSTSTDTQSLDVAGSEFERGASTSCSPGACQLNLCSIPKAGKQPSQPSCTPPFLRCSLHLAKAIDRLESDRIGSVLVWSGWQIQDRRSRIVISLLWQLAATFFMSSCDRRHKLSQIAPRCLSSYGLQSAILPAARGIQSLCQQKLFLTATTTRRRGQTRSNGETSLQINWT